MSTIEAELAAEMQHIAHTAAEPVKGGETVKRQMERAWEALGHPARWRLRAAWNGLAGPWRGTAHEDFRRRDAERRRKEANGRARATELVERYAKIAAHLRKVDPDFYREQIDGLEHVVAQQGARRGSVDGAGGDD